MKACAKAIETHYKDCRFRSRLEARWAVFFDALGIAWEYEKEGFELPSGRYLPDFWLPRTEMWAEVKGQEFSLIEQQRCKELTEATRHPCLMLIGPPECRSYDAWQVSPSWVDDYVLGHYHDYYHTERRFYGSTGSSCHVKDEPYYFDERYHEAIAAARSARFEFGEQGAPLSAQTILKGWRLEVLKDEPPIYRLYSPFWDGYVELTTQQCISFKLLREQVKKQKNTLLPTANMRLKDFLKQAAIPK